MSFFTALTLLVALTNPVTDCGCFGDAIILTNWQTFFKNIIFLVPTVLVFVERNRYDRPFTAKADWIIVATLFMGSVMLSLYCFRNLPLIDFRPYHRGANIEEGMAIPEGMPVDRYETVMIYKKNGVEAEYTLKSPEQPWADTTYTWVATNNILVEKGYEPPIHDFTLVDSTGEDVTAQVLADPGYSLLVVNYDLTRASRDGMERVSRFAAQAQQNGLKVYGMTSSLHEVVEQVQTQFDLTYAYYTTDEITLKTMVRSNPGVILLKQGTVLDKWHYRNLPDSAYFETQLNANALSQLEKARNRNLSFTWVMILLFIGFVVLYFRPGRGLLAG